MSLLSKYSFFIFMIFLLLGCEKSIKEQNTSSTNHVEMANIDDCDDDDVPTKLHNNLEPIAVKGCKIY